MPKLPESATLAAAPFPLSLVWSAALTQMDVASTALKRMASFTAFTFLPPKFCFLLFCSYVCRLQQLFNLRCDLLHRFIQRLHGESGQSVICATSGKQLVEPCILLRQRTHFVFSLAAPPKFLYRSFQQNRDCAAGHQRVTILLLHERPAAE